MVESSDVEPPLPLGADISAYRSLTERCEENPHTPGLWEEILALAQAEEESPLAEKGYFGSLSLSEMIDLKQELDRANATGEKFHVLGAPASTGELWYDILLGHYNDTALESISTVIEEFPFKKGLDIGSGYGNSLLTLQKHADTVVGLDRSVLLQRVARTKTPEAGLVGGDALHLPFQDHSFDLILSNGLTKYLPDEDLPQFAREIQRVLTPKGLYVWTFGMRNEDGSIPVQEDRLDNAKGVVAAYLEAMVTWQEPVSVPEGSKSSLQAELDAFEEAGFVYQIIPEMKNRVHVVEVFNP
jgi:SAM-dependent methyltransferase